MSTSGTQTVQCAEPSGYPAMRAEVRLLLVALAVYAAVLTALVLRRNSRLVYNDMRGAPTLGLFHGVSIYQIGLKKVVFSVLYGPFSYLFHLPAAVFHSPQIYFLAASAISFLIYCSPLVLFVLHARRAAGFWTAFLLAVVFFLFTLNSEALVFSSMGFSPDAATIGFAGLACAILFFYDGKRPWLDPALIAAFTCCSIGSKQNMAVLLFVLPLFALILRGRAFAIRLTACLGAAIVVSLGVIWGVYGDLYTVYFNNIVVPRHFPLLWNRGPLAVQYLYGQSVLLLFALGCLALLLFRNRRGELAGKTLNRNQLSRILLFAVMTVCVTPFSIMGVVFWGGAYNALSPSLYFELLTLMALSYILLLEMPVEWGRCQTAMAMLLLFAAVQAPLLSKHFYPLSILHKDFAKSSSELVYAYELKHPGEVYFPFNQVVVYFAEHKFYQADWGIGNLVLGKVPFTEAEVRSHIPPAARYVAYPPDVNANWLAPYITPHRKSAQLPGLPGFSIFEMEP